MNTIRSIAARSPHRLPARLKLVATRLGSLILLFQRMPVVQFLFPEANIIGGASVANTISLAVTTVVGLGAFDSVAGQSQISQRTPLVVLGNEPAGTDPTTANAINVPATVSAPLNFGFNWDPRDDFSSVKSWRCTTNGFVGTLPAGLSPALDSNATDNNGVTVGVGTIIPITGTPTTPGIYPVKINVYISTGYNNTTAAQIFNICVLGFSPQPATTTTISSGQTATLTCTAQGFPIATTLHNVTPIVTYQWYQGDFIAGTAILGASGTLNKDARTASYTTPNNLSGTTNYWVKVTSVLSGNTVSANSTAAAVNVTPASSPFDTWASGLETLNGPLDIPQGDGVTNLMKYACNLNPLAPDVSKLTVGGSEPKGLPVQSIVGGKLRMEFLRRKASPNPGITYFVEFSSDMGGASWSSQNVSTLPGGNPVGTDWERVVVDDITGGTARFGRVKVVKTP